MDLFDAIEAGDLPAVQRALAAGEDPNLRNESTGYSALAEAAGTGRADVVRALLDAGAEVDGGRGVGVPLVCAAGGGHAEVVRLLLSRGAGPNVQDEYGHTALIAAAAWGSADLVQELLDRGADPERFPRKGCPAVVAAAENGHRAVVDLLMPLSLPGDAEYARRLVERVQRVGWVFNDLNEGKGGALEHYLAAGGSPDAVAPWDEDSRVTLLMLAAERGRLDWVSRLLEAGADPNREDGSGDTALCYTARRGGGPVYDLLYSVTAERHRAAAETIRRGMDAMGIGSW